MPSQRFRRRLKSKSIKSVPDGKARDLLEEKGFDPVYGARPMRRAVEHVLEDPLAEEILKGNLHDNDPVQITAVDGKLVFLQKAEASEAVSSCGLTHGKM